MPSEMVSVQQARSSTSVQRSSLSTDRLNNEHPSTSPNLQNGNSKPKKHVFHAARAHSRVPTNKGNHKSHDGEPGNRKPPRNGSMTSLKKNNSHVNLKRNRSSAEVKFKPTVAFEIGEQEEGWEETSSSASPALSRTKSRSTSKPTTSASTTKLQSQVSRKVSKGSSENKNDLRSTSIDPKVITERLLSRTPSHHTTQMSLTTATPSSKLTTARNSQVEFLQPVESSRLVIGSTTSIDVSQFIQLRSPSSMAPDDFKRAQSMGNFADLDPDEEETSALAPRPRHLGGGQSRTQKKLWLQRASSSIEQKKMTSQFGELTSLVGAAYEGRDPRIKSQLERTGQEYQAVRRYQDPVANSLKRIDQIPGWERNRRITRNPKKSVDSTIVGSGTDRYGLSQSLRSHIEHRENSSSASALRNYIYSPGHSVTDCFVGHLDADKKHYSASVADCDSVTVLLRKMWDKSSGLGTSAD
ncbi:hypothetical protein K3495_g13878 [Podosphaera aphanis]|nr:hypothetical protein K3495_g13878 [Podosphaera aphanis]